MTKSRTSSRAASARECSRDRISSEVSPPALRLAVQPDELRGVDLLADAVLLHLEIGRRESGDRLVAAANDRYVDADHLHARAEDRRLCWGGCCCGGCCGGCGEAAAVVTARPASTARPTPRRSRPRTPFERPRRPYLIVRSPAGGWRLAAWGRITLAASSVTPSPAAGRPPPAGSAPAPRQSPASSCMLPPLQATLSERPHRFRGRVERAHTEAT